MDSYENQKSKKPVFLTVAFLAALALLYTLFSRDGGHPRTVKRAVVVLKGDTRATGTVYFEQSSSTAPVKVTGKLRNLDPNALRGFHVHQFGDLTNGCLSAGPHFNPFGNHHGAPSDSERHVGDLGNIKTNEAGEANFSFEDSLISLNGPRSIIGRAVVLHTGTDDLGRGDNEESLKTGNAGGRAACGVIGRSLPASSELN